jgi:tetratricopeptide (TPR) repeat protein
MPSFSELETAQQLEVAELCLRLPSFAGWGSQIRYSPSGQTGREETVNLLMMCAAQPGGFTKLLEAVRFYDGGTHQYAALVGKLADLGLRDSFPATCWTNVPQRLMVFAGRDTELQQLREALMTDGGRAAIYAVHGMGGVGKTSVATEYAHRHRDLYGIVGWFRLADEYGKTDAAQTKTSVEAGYAALASSLGLAVAGEQDYGVIRRAVMGVLAKRPDWLLVFDNAEDPAALREYLPEGNGHILITSRTAHWHGVARPVALDVWDDQTALKFLLDFTGRTGWQDAAEAKAAGELVKELGGLPLAVHQAAAYMAAASVSVAAYRKLFAKHKLKLFNDTPPDYHAPVTTTWDIGVEALASEQPEALLLLNLCAFFAPEPIRFALLQQPEARKWVGDELAALLDPDDELVLMEVKKALRRYALANVSETSISLHRMMGLVTRERLTTDEQRRYAEYAAYAMHELYPDPLDYDNWERCEELLRHAEAAALYAEESGIASNAAGYLYNSTGLYLSRRASYPAARQNYERAVALGEHTLALDDPELAAYYNNLGTLLKAMGDLPAFFIDAETSTIRPSNIGFCFLASIISWSALLLSSSRQLSVFEWV